MKTYQNHSNIKKGLVNRFKRLFIVVIGLVLMTACQQEAVELNISAASSLQESLEEMAALFMEKNPDVNINLNFAGSNVLMRQIAEGFDVDVFLSAHWDPVDELTELGMVGIGEQFARNELVLVTSSDAIESFYDIANEGVRLIFANDSVPVGIYSREVLANVDLDHPGFKETVMGNMISEEGNVRQVLLKVSLGEGDGAFVYRTDITESVVDSVTVIELPDEYRVISTLYMALIERDDIQDEARAFYEFVLSEEGQAILSNHGFQ